MTKEAQAVELEARRRDHHAKAEAQEAAHAARQKSLPPGTYAITPPPPVPFDPAREWHFAARASELPRWSAKRNFRSWLSRQVGRTDSLGSLARFADEDRAFPVNPMLLIPHLTATFAEPAVLYAARVALREWLVWCVEDIGAEACKCVNPDAAAAVRSRAAEALGIVRGLLAAELEKLA